MPNNRIFPRTSMKCRVKVFHESIGEKIITTRDISDGGIFLITPNIEMPPIGTIVTGQIQDLPMEGPILKLEIVRVDDHGVGLRFINENE